MNSVRVHVRRYHRRRKYQTGFQRMTRNVPPREKDGRKPGSYNEFSELHVIWYCWSFKYKANERREISLQKKAKVRSQRTLNGLSRSLSFIL